MMKENKEKEIKDIDGFLHIIKTYRDQQLNQGQASDFLFRGQPVDCPLIPKLLRLRPKTDLLVTERTLLQEFKRTNPLLVAPYQAIDDWDILTLGQHFGLPTRLLDWTDRALTALWFATDYVATQSAKQEYALIWVLMPNEKDYLNDKEVEAGPFNLNETKLYRPRIIKQRINTQSGMFSVHSTPALKSKRHLLDESEYTSKLVKIRVHKSHFAAIRADMHTLGVNAFTLFPELEGLSAFLQWKFFK